MPNQYAGRVRCLGPSKREHTFWSEDRRKYRICPACRKKIAEMNVPPILERPIRDPQDTPGNS